MTEKPNFKRIATAPPGQGQGLLPAKAASAAGHDHSHQGHSHGDSLSLGRNESHSHGPGGHNHGPGGHRHGPGGHNHHEALFRDIQSASIRSITIAFTLNLFFTVFEIVGSYYSGSIAVLADAVHDFGDSISLGLAIYLHKVAGRSNDQDYSYGYRRFTLLSAMISGIVIIAGSLYVFAMAIQRFNQPSTPRALPMLGLAVVGVIVNGIAALKLARGNTHSTQMLKWHLIEDSLGWVIVLIGSIMIYWKGWVWIDPLLAILLSVFVAYNVIKHLKGTVELLLQRKPSQVDSEVVIAKIRAIVGVSDLHDLHIWSLDGEQNVMSLHIVLRDDKVNAALVKENIQKIMEGFGAFHTTIETELIGDHCHDRCN